MVSPVVAVYTYLACISDTEQVASSCDRMHF